MKRFTQSLALAATAAVLLTVTACGGTPAPAAAPEPVPGVATFLAEQYADTAWLPEVTGATVDASGVLTVHTDYPTGTDPDARTLAKAVCTAGKMYVMTRGTDAMDGTVTVEAADTLMLAHC